MPSRRPQKGRRLLVLTGVVAIVGALISAAVSFAILVGVTPITPDNTTTLTLIAVNAGFVLLLIGLIGRELHRIYVARRRGKAASRLHVRIVTMFSLVAAIPAIMVAVVASITLDIGLDRWFEIRTKTIISSSLSIAEPMSRRMRAICRARRCRWPTTSTARAPSTASTAPAFATS